MRIFANNKIWKKIVIIIGILLSFSIVVPEPVEADLGGKLMQPIMSLFIGIGDGINTVIQKMFLEQEPSVLVISAGVTWWKVALGILIGVALIVAGTVASILAPIALGAVLVITISIAAMEGGNGGAAKTSDPIAFQLVTGFTASMLSDKGELALPMIQLSPYEIFSNKGNIFSVNFFKNLSDDEKYTDEKKENKTLLYSMQDSIASWYKTFRLIAIIGMLPVLVYIGIRILISAPSDKAKYKENLMDWSIAFLLIFAMHYIMSFSNIIIDDVTDMIGSIDINVDVKTDAGGVQTVNYKNQSVEGFLIGVKGEGENAEIDDDTTEGVKGEGENAKIDDDTTELVRSAYEKMISGESATETTKKYAWCFWTDLSGTQASGDGEGNAKILFWPCDNFVAQSRMYAQRAKGDYAYIGYGLIYVILTIYTCIFIFVYIRRFIYMSFLTLISPLVALTYPIDKIRDGKAQAFEFWFKEYFYNLLLQPLHLLLYMILVGTAMNFAAKHPIYVCVILGLMVPLEKLLKQMFGFRGETPGSLPGMAAGALMMGASQRIFGRHPKGLGGGNGSNKSGNDDDVKPIKMKDVDTSGGNLIGSGRGAPNPGGGRGAPNPGGGRGALNPGSGRGTPNPGGGRGAPNPGGGRGAPNPGGRRNGVLSANSKRRLRKISAPLRYTGRAFGKYFKNNGKKLAKSAGKSAIRFAGGAASAAVGATGGMIAGVVSGDPSKAASYIAAGGVAAYSLGSRAAENIPDIVSSQANAIKDEYYLDNPDKYEEIQRNKQRKEWLKNEKNINTLKLNGINYKDLNKNGDLDDYIDHGFNAKQIVAAQQMRNEGFDHKQVMTIAAMADKYYEGATGVDSGKYKTKMKENLKSSTEGANLSDQQLNNAVDRSIGYMKNYHKHLDKVKTL